ncbi:MAG: riboflavin synthase subunit alpha [Syntrophobacteraceae bacterium CG2_30_61_12]|nr:MAG: riboflavin synthase subunit alpha [Syntrophobacteraceae bacterium CG2_30_61_12]PIU32452.1 MAG: riboflavin synthase [Syntrophobacteraceae bacterium CG07_land_8_20_14_0_80_61_8]
MFTGLIEGTGRLVRIDGRGPDAKLVITAEYAIEHLVLGESIAVDGACLTVASFDQRGFTVDVSAETLRRTTLGGKTPGARFNLERALRLGDRLGGHLVAGHVDGVGTLIERFPEGRSWRLSFRVAPTLTRYLIEKGSVAVNGISLTVNGCEAESFHVNIIPHTGGATTIGDWKIGDRVNLETDLIGKYVEKLLGGYVKTPIGESESKIDADFLRKHGFL